jgi:hypothetical protein
MDRDIEMGIDRETTDLVDMLENTGKLKRRKIIPRVSNIKLILSIVEERSSTFFKFKDEQLFNNDNNQDIVSIIGRS